MKKGGLTVLGIEFLKTYVLADCHENRMQTHNTKNPVRSPLQEFGQNMFISFKNWLQIEGK